MPEETAAVLIPIKSFDLAKGRLSTELLPEQRSSLARAMATNVIAAAGDLPVWVVCGDVNVAALAERLGAEILWREPKGLNVAITEGRDFLAGRGIDRVIVAHADLPLARDLTWLAGARDVTLVPDRRNDGSNVLSVPTNIGFEFAYGPGSAMAHRREAERLGVPFHLVTDGDLGWDIDIPEDLTAIAHLIDRPTADDNQTETPS